MIRTSTPPSFNCFNVVEAALRVGITPLFLKIRVIRQIAIIVKALLVYKFIFIKVESK